MIIPVLALLAPAGDAAATPAAVDTHQLRLLPGRGEARVRFLPREGGKPVERLFRSGDDHHAYRVEPGNSYFFPESTWDRFTGNRHGDFVIEVTTREDEEVWASGRRLSREPAEEAGFAVTRFAGAEVDRGLGLYVVARKAAAEGGFPPGPVWADTMLRQSLAVFSELFGALPSRYPRVIVLDFPRPIAKSLPGALFLDTRLVQRNSPPPASRVAVMAHETAHLWWPNRVRSRGPGASALHEGLAEFAACRVVSQVLGEAAGEARWQALRDEYLAASESMQVAGVSLVDGGKGGDYGRALRYARSAWVVRMLSVRVGEAAFAEAMEALLEERFPFSWEGLSAALAAASGVDLSSFHEHWLAGSGHPNLSVRTLKGQPPILANSGGGSGEVPVQQLCGEVPGAVRWIAVPAGSEHSWPEPLATGCKLVIDPDGRWLVGARGPGASPGLILGRAWGYPVVTSVADGSPAHTAGLRQGDLILVADGQPQDEERVAALVRRMSGGTPVMLRVRRGRNELDVQFQPPPR